MRPFPHVLAAAVLVPAAVALAAADLREGTIALRSAYESTDGDEGGFGGTLVDQCRVEGESEVRCVLLDASGNTDLDSGDADSSGDPVSFAVATFAANGTISTRLEAFTEPVAALDVRLTVPETLKPTSDGRLRIRVRSSRVARVRIDGQVGRKVHARAATAELPANRTLYVDLPLSTHGRTLLRRELARSTQRARFDVSVEADVGPAFARRTIRRHARVSAR